MAIFAAFLFHKISQCIVFFTKFCFVYDVGFIKKHSFLLLFFWLIMSKERCCHVFFFCVITILFLFIFRTDCSFFVAPVKWPKTKWNMTFDVINKRTQKEHEIIFHFYFECFADLLVLNGQFQAINWYIFPVKMKWCE